MANVVEKIFKLILNFGDSEERVPMMSKLLQSLHDRLKNVLKTINDIGKADGLKKAADVLGVYTLTVEKAEKAKKKLVAADKEEKTKTAEATKYIEDLKNKYGNLIFTKREIATLSKNYATLMRAEKGSAEELQAKINVLNTVWKKLGATQRNSVMGKQVTADLKSMRDEMRNLTVGAGDFSRNIGNYFSGMYNTVTRRIAGITGIVFTLKQVLRNIYGPFQDLEYRMSMVKAVSRATDEEFMSLEADARRLGAATQYTATQVAELQIVYAQIGFNPQQIIAVTEATLELATATGEDLAKSADVAGSTLQGFNLDVSEIPRVIDVMTLALNKSALKLDTYGEAMKYVGPIAAQTGVSIEECSALIGSLADQGIRGSMAGTALRRILSELAVDGRPLNERLAELSKTGISVTDAMDEVGKHAMTALTIIGNDTEKINALVAAFNAASGAAKEAAEITRDNMRTDSLIFLSAVQEKLIAIGEVLAPLGRAVIQVGTWAVTNIKAIASSILVATGLVLAYNQVLKIKVYWSKLSALNEKANALVTALNTVSLSGNTAALITNSIAVQNASALTKAYALVKLLFAGNIKAATVAMRAFTTSMMSNPLGIFTVALAAIASYFIFFRDKADAATRAQQKFNDENDRFNKAQDEKRQRIEQLIRTIQDETETEYAKIRAYEELGLLSPALTDKYSQEQIATLKLAESAKILNEQRDKETYGNLVTNVEKYTASLNKLKEEYDAMQGANVDGSFTPSQGSKRLAMERQMEEQKILLADYKKELKEVDKARQQVAENAKPIKVRIEATENIVEEAEEAFNKAKAAYNLKRNEWVMEHGTEATLPFFFKFDYLTTEKELADARRKLAELQKQQKTTSTGDGDKKEKGEWSLSKDKDHNRQLLDLKKKLHNGEIFSEEQYQKQVLQLEIDSLTKRIALNKDEAKTILKLKNELWDKQNQQKKNEQKENETYTANRKAQTEKELKYENDRVDAEIAAIKEGVEKKIRLNEQVTKKAEETAAKEYQTEIDRLSKEQKAHEVGSARYKEIEAEKTRLTELYGQKKTDIEKAGADARTKILQDATQMELTEYGKLPGKAAEAEQQITENKRREVEKRLKLARQETANSVAGAKNQYDADEAVSDATLGKKGRKRNVAGVANEVQLHKNLSQAYVKELNDIIAGGDDAIEQHKERYNELIGLIGQEQQAAMNLGKGKKADGTRKSFWTQLTELSDEDISQIKQQAFNLAQQLSDAIFNAKQEASQRQLNAEKKAIDAEYKTEAKLLDSKRDKGLISEKKYQEELEKLEAKKAEKEEASEREAFERKKKLDIKQALINTALAVGSALATSKPFLPMGPIMAAFAFAQGMVQVATIASQKYAQGGVIPLGNGAGIIKGRSHAQGGHQIYLDGQPIGEVEGDELLAIVNKHDTARIGALSAANSVHGRRFAQGGLVAPSSFLVNHAAPPVSIGQIEARQQTEQAKWQQENQDRIIQSIREDTKRQIEAINNRIDTLKVVVLEHDITDTQNNIKKIKVKSSW